MSAIFCAAALIGCAGSSPTPTSGDDDSGDNGFPGDKPTAFAEDDDPLTQGLDTVENELLVLTKPGAGTDALSDAFAQSCTSAIAELPEIGLTKLSVNPGRLESAAFELTDHSLVESVHRNYRYPASELPNDPRFASQSYLESIGLPQAWDTTTGRANIIIAILDTGVASDHPDLIGKVISGWNTFNNSSDSNDVAGHGTAVAGVAAALSDNRTGVVGVSWQSPIMPIRVSDASGVATAYDIAAGLVWAADHGATVANVSFAPLASDRTVQRAAGYFKASGGLVFISAGNDGQSTTSTGSPNAIYVAAVAESGAHAFFSTRGPFVDVAAPGLGIAALERNGGYQTVDGTSFASPIAAGVAALIWSVRPELRPATVEQLILTTANDLGADGKDDELGMGVIDAAAAVAAALDAAEPTDNAAPRVSITNPSDNATVSGAIDVVVDASDETELADVVLMIDGQFFAVDDQPPYDFGVETRDLSPGVHTLVCQAADVVGNLTASNPIRIQVEASSPNVDLGDCDPDGPQVVFNFPAPESDVTGQVAIQITATDNVGLSTVDWTADGVAASAATLTGVRDSDTFIWDATNATQGRHTITATVTDINGNTTRAELELNKP